MQRNQTHLGSALLIFSALIGCNSNGATGPTPVTAVRPTAEPNAVGTLPEPSRATPPAGMDSPKPAKASVNACRDFKEALTLKNYAERHEPYGDRFAFSDDSSWMAISRQNEQGLYSVDLIDLKLEKTYADVATGKVCYRSDGYKSGQLLRLEFSRSGRSLIINGLCRPEEDFFGKSEPLLVDVPKAGTADAAPRVIRTLDPAVHTTFLGGADRQLLTTGVDGSLTLIDLDRGTDRRLRDAEEWTRDPSIFDPVRFERYPIASIGTLENGVIVERAKRISTRQDSFGFWMRITRTGSGEAEPDLYCSKYSVGQARVVFASSSQLTVYCGAKVVTFTQVDGVLRKATFIRYLGFAEQGQPDTVSADGAYFASGYRDEIELTSLLADDVRKIRLSFPRQYMTIRGVAFGEGHRLFVSASDGQENFRSVLIEVDVDSGAIRTLADFADQTFRASRFRYLPGPKKLYLQHDYYGHHQSGVPHTRLYDPASGQLTAIENRMYVVPDFEFSRDGRWMFEPLKYTGNPDLRYVSPTLQKFQPSCE